MDNIDKEINDRIEALTFRFEHSVTAVDIFRWLRNFEEKDWNMALLVLENVVYYSGDLIDNTFKTYISKIKSLYFKPLLKILPIGSIGKSGSAMAYHIHKLIRTETRTMLIQIEDLKNVQENDVIVLLDDFAGTGKSIENFFETKVIPITGEKVKFCVLCVAFMTKAKELMDKLKIPILGDEYSSAFARRGSTFGTGENMKIMREFCFQNAVQFYPKWKISHQKPLGYMNSQSMVCFEHTTPNNSLPILWENKKNPITNKEWYPLFPRYIGSRIQRGKTYRKESAFWMFTLKKQLPYLINRDITIDKKALPILTILIFKANGKSDAYIAQALGLGYIDYNNFIQMAIEQGILNKNNTMNKRSCEIVAEIKKRNKILKTKTEKKITYMISPIHYLPKSFHGFT